MKTDEYRVTLFKKKIRGILPEFEGLRFNRSLGKCHLIIDLSWRYGPDVAEEYGAVIMAKLKSNGIQAQEQRDRYGLSKLFGGKERLDCIGIPIDQEALPERRGVK